MLKTKSPMDKREPKSLAEVETARAKNKVKALRDKLSSMVDDPDTREAMVRHIQRLLREDEKR